MRARWAAVRQAWQAAQPRPLPAAEQERVLAAARVERHGALTTLYLAGTPYEMGYQHGVLARDLIHGFRQLAYAYVDSLLPGPAWAARPLLFYQAAAFWPTIPPDLAREMQGIADGAGVHPIEVLVSTAIWEMYLVSGCSEFAAVGPATASGGLLHGYNYDLMHPDHSLIQPFLAAIFYRPSEGTPFVTVNTAGSVGANSGMNEAGISVAWDNTYLRDNGLTQGIQGPAAPFIVTLRRLLQHSRSLEGALGTVIRSLPRPLADVIIVGSAAEGRAVALETAGAEYAVREMEDGVLWSCNCFRSPELARHDRRGDGSRLAGEQAWRRFPRYTAYGELLAGHGGRRGHRGRLTPASAAALLRDPYPREAEGHAWPVAAPRSTICRDISSWSLVMEPGEGRLWASDTRLPGPQGRFFAFDLPGWRRLPELDLAPSGYHAALRAAECFLEGDLGAAGAALEEAQALDGEAAPLLLMRAVLAGVAGEEESAAESARQVAARWDGSPPGALARAWLDGAPSPETEPPPVPFPSAIRPLIQLRRGFNWKDRVARALTW